jgi:hypothetical protein
MLEVKMFKSGTESGDYHEMNFGNYETWLKTQLIPNLPPTKLTPKDKVIPLHAMEALGGRRGIASTLS